MTHASRNPGSIGRRAVLLLAAAGSLAGCDASAAPWHAHDVTGTVAPLAFAMTDATTAQKVTEADVRGRVVLLTFGYTFCPDICPTTLTNLAAVLHGLGPLAERVRVLFVTVDPGRDTLEGLRRYTALFAPEIVGLRGTPDQIARLARRYRVAYSVSVGPPYEVTHSSLIYVFDGSGAGRLLIASMATAMPDVEGVTADVRRLVRKQAVLF